MTNEPDSASAVAFKPPERLFRYFSPRQAGIFAEKKLWFSTAVQFNDIFEVVPRYDKLIPQLVDRAMMKKYAFLPPNLAISFEQFKKATERLRAKVMEDCNEEYPESFQKKVSESYGIVCFSENLDSLLMWGHYTDCHRGFVVEFNPQHALFTPRDFAKVSYGKNRPLLSLDSTPSSALLLCKSSEWAYEVEYRLIKLKSQLLNETYEVNGIKVERHYMLLPMDSIKAVYFGCRISTENRNHLLQSLESHPHVQRFFMRRHRIEYKLDVVPWEQWQEPDAEVRKIMTDFH